MNVRHFLCQKELFEEEVNVMKMTKGKFALVRWKRLRVDVLLFLIVSWVFIFVSLWQEPITLAMVSFLDQEICIVARSPFQGACSSILSPCQGIFTDRFIFRLNFFSCEIGHFWPTWAHIGKERNGVLRWTCRLNLSVKWWRQLKIESSLEVT